MYIIPRLKQTTQMTVEALRQIEPSPRVKLAAQLYVSGACGTKREASETAGLHPNYLTMLSNNSEPVQRLMDDLANKILDESIDSAVTMRTLGRNAILKLYRLMDSSNENIQLKAAQDLADRSPETQKTQKLELSGLSLGASDAKELARALIESANENKAFADIAVHGLDEVRMDEPKPLQLVKGASDE